MLGASKDVVGADDVTARKDLLDILAVVPEVVAGMDCFGMQYDCCCADGNWKKWFRRLANPEEVPVVPLALALVDIVGDVVAVADRDSVVAAGGTEDSDSHLRLPSSLERPEVGNR
jgi:hypothetical protein